MLDTKHTAGRSYNIFLCARADASCDTQEVINPYEGKRSFVERCEINKCFIFLKVNSNDVNSVIS